MLIYSLPVSPQKRSFPGGACQCRKHERHELSLWVGKTPRRRAWWPTPVFLPGNPMDGGAWRAAVHWVAESQTWLKWLSTHTPLECRLPRGGHRCVLLPAGLPSGAQHPMRAGKHAHIMWVTQGCVPEGGHQMPAFGLMTQSIGSSVASLAKWEKEF